MFTVHQIQRRVGLRPDLAGERCELPGRQKGKEGQQEVKSKGKQERKGRVRGGGRQRKEGKRWEG